MIFIFFAGLAALAGIPYASLFEWLLHKYFMHRTFVFFGYAFRYPFHGHVEVHHRIFKADRTYHLQNSGDKKTIPMAWWNGPALIAVGSLPFVAASSLSGHWAILVGGAFSCAVYYGFYEYLHWCMHLPKKRRLEKLGVFSFLNGHHVLHHRYMAKNFNVVLPMWDAIFGTLMVRSKINFPQPLWPVPNLQPLA